MTGRFQFRALGKEAAERASFPGGASKIRGLCALDEEAFSLTYGRLLTLFGPPAIISRSAWESKVEKRILKRASSQTKISETWWGGWILNEL